MALIYADKTTRTCSSRTASTNPRYRYGAHYRDEARIAWSGGIPLNRSGAGEDEFFHIPDPTEKSIETKPCGRLQLREVALLALSTVLAQAFLRQDYFVGWFNDDACYLLRAYQFANSGLCYVCNLPIQGIDGFAIGWPFVLTPFVFLFGKNIALYRLVTLTLLVLSVLAVSDISCRRHGKRAGLLLGLVLAFSWNALYLGTSLMSEPCYLFVATSILWVDETQPPGRRSILCGLLAGFAALVRTEGLIFIVAISLLGLLRGRWKDSAISGMAFLLIFAGAQWFSTPASPHAGQISNFLNAGFGLWNFLIGWTMNQLLLIGTSFLNGPSWFCRGLAFAGLLLFAYGLAVKPRRFLTLEPWVVLGTFGAMMLWPYLDSRYWMAAMPAWLLIWQSALTSRHRLFFFLPLLVLELISGFVVSRVEQSYIKSVENMYLQLNELPTDVVVASPTPGRTHLLAHRRTASFYSEKSLGLLTRNLVFQNGNALIWQSGLKRSLARLDGGSQFETPPYFEEWVRCSTLYRLTYDQPVGFIARISTTKQDMEQAVAIWNQAIQTPDVSERLVLLNKALDVVEDFPEIRVHRFQTALEVETVDKDTKAQYILPYLRQYPHDFQTAVFAVNALDKLGAQEQAKEVAGLGLREAKRLGASRYVQTFGDYLK